jgi:hypothetical protein
MVRLRGCQHGVLLHGGVRERKGLAVATDLVRELDWSGHLVAVRGYRGGGGCLNVADLVSQACTAVLAERLGT